MLDELIEWKDKWKIEYWMIEWMNTSFFVWRVACGIGKSMDVEVRPTWIWIAHIYSLLSVWIWKMYLALWSLYLSLLIGKWRNTYVSGLLWKLSEITNADGLGNNGCTARLALYPPLPESLYVVHNDSGPIYSL